MSSAYSLGESAIEQLSTNPRRMLSCNLKKRWTRTIESDEVY